MLDYTITFENLMQKTLWDVELSGQISDGMWENTQNTSWKMWCSAETVVGKCVGRSGFNPRKDNFAFNSTKLLDCVGARMLAFAKLAKAVADGKLPENINVEHIESGLVMQITSDNTLNVHGLIEYGPQTEFWDSRRKAVTDVGFELVKYILESDDYTWKDLRSDLRVISKTIKVAV